jgi:ribonuclease HI
MTAKTKYYVVWKGRKTGIFDSWEECSAQVSGFTGAEYMAFESRAAAEKAFASPYSDYRGKRTSVYSQQRLLETGGPILDSYSVDASCSGNPGVLEYRCLHTQSRKLLFKQGPFPGGTNNIGEFLAIVHALRMCKERGDSRPIYSDSDTALAWVKKKKARTTLPASSGNPLLFERIARAEEWLKENAYRNKVLKWDTAAWGEIPADYGRK